MFVVSTLFAVLALAGPPAGPAPRVAGVAAAPPPAWVGTSSRSVWLGFGSYCWKTVCAAMIPPGLRPDLPRLRAVSGAWVTVHVRFTPKALTATRLAGRKSVRVPLQRPGKLVARFIARPGVVTVMVTGPRGDASYVVRIVAG